MESGRFVDHRGALCIFTSIQPTRWLSGVTSWLDAAHRARACRTWAAMRASGFAANGPDPTRGRQPVASDMDLAWMAWPTMATSSSSHSLYFSIHLLAGASCSTVRVQKVFVSTTKVPVDPCRRPLYYRILKYVYGVTQGCNGILDYGVLCISQYIPTKLAETLPSAEYRPRMAKEQSHRPLPSISSTFGPHACCCKMFVRCMSDPPVAKPPKEPDQPHIPSLTFTILPTGLDLAARASVRCSTSVRSDAS